MLGIIINIIFDDSLLLNMEFTFYS